MGRRRKKPGYPKGYFDDPPTIKDANDKRKNSYSVERRWLWNDGQRSCHYCDQPLVLKTGRRNSMTLDHKRALSGGGRNKRVNYLPACADCNNAKGSMSYDEFMLCIRDGYWPKKPSIRNNPTFIRVMNYFGHYRTVYIPIENTD